MPSEQKRTTVYFESAIHRALRLKSIETERSLSDLVNEAVRLALAEDAEDLAAFEERAVEEDLSFEEVVKDLKRRGKIGSSDQAVGRKGDRGDLEPARPPASRRQDPTVGRRSAPSWLQEVLRQ